MKDDSLLINTLALNIYLRHRNVFQNGVNHFSKIVDHFLPKSSQFCIFRTVRFCSIFSSMLSKYTSQIMYGATLDFQYQRQWWLHKMPDLKINLCSKYAIKTLLCHRCTCWHLKSEVSPNIIWNIFGSHTGEIWIKSYGPKCIEFLAYRQKSEILKSIFEKKKLTSFCKTFL